jgi:hypothetical protein
MKASRRRNGVVMSFLPAFLRRRVLLARARELLGANDARAALALLCDPIFEGVPDAAEMARQANQLLENEPRNGNSGAMRDLLARLRAERGARSSPADGGPRTGAVASLAPPAGTAGSALRFRLAVDDAGELLVAAGETFLIGHLGSPTADLPFLAHVEREHARLALSLGFHGGPSWRIAPVGSARVVVEDAVVGPAGRELADGDRVLLGQNLDLRFRAEVPASSSAVLELGHGLECLGSPRVLLLVPGADGSVLLGSKRARHVRVPGLDHDVVLEMGDVLERDDSGCANLTITCAGGVESGVRPTDASPRSIAVGCPPPSGRRITLGARARDKAPFEIALLPVDDPPRGPQ